MAILPDKPVTESAKPKKLMIIAAEASGDVLGAGLMRALTRQSSVPLVFCGVGGQQMRALGVESPFDIAQLSILGMSEGLKAYKRVKARVADTVALAVAEKPDAVVLIDSWGFTLRVAKGIREVMPEVPLIKYVGPQVWATRPGRAKTLAQSVDLLLALHQMDAPYFEAEGLETVVVGNPALNVDFSQADPAAFRQSHGLTPDTKLLLVLPGSRPAEIRRLMPVFTQTLQRLSGIYPDLRFAMPVADTVRDLVQSYLQDVKLPLIITETETEKLSAMQAADVALACSGTVSTELALAGCPMIIAYQVEWLTFFIFKHVSPLKYVTLFNILADKEVAPEFIQKDCSVENLVQALSARLNDKALRAHQTSEQFAALDLMGRGQEPPAELAAQAVIKHLKI
ncbi:MAG: lipid-A-disaccharide synthase [Asticcacaulis sp.]